MMIEPPNWSVKCRKIQPKTSNLPHWNHIEHLPLNLNRCSAVTNSTNGKSLAAVNIINYLSCLLTKAQNNFLTVVLFVCSYNLTNCHGHTISRCTTKKMYYVICTAHLSWDQRHQTPSSFSPERCSNESFGRFRWIYLSSNFLLSLHLSVLS